MQRKTLRPLYIVTTSFLVVLLHAGAAFGKKDCRTDIEKAFDGSFAASAIQMRHLLLYTPITCNKTIDLHNGGIHIDNGWSTRSGYVSRFGYEIAFPWYLLESLSYETNYQSYHALVVMVNISTPQVLLLPMFSFGVGMPVKLTGDTRAGIRLQAGLQLFSVGFYYSFDLYPGTGEPLRNNMTSTFMGRVSF